MSVDDLDAACQRFEDAKINWKKRLTDGRMRHVAFILDPVCNQGYAWHISKLDTLQLVKHRDADYKCRITTGLKLFRTRNTRSHWFTCSGLQYDAQYISEG